MNQPVIGITASYDVKSDKAELRQNYVNALRHFHALPVILPSELSSEEAASYAARLDGILFSGGDDLHPFLYHEEVLRGCKSISTLRDQTELNLFSCFYQQKKPILGICRGIQLINTALGGTLYQDLSSQYRKEPAIAHQQPLIYSAPSHRVFLEPESRLAAITGQSELAVNSMHHQAIKDPADSLTVSARSSDHIIEAVEAADYPWLLGVQWHPEYLFPEENAKKIFESFVNACIR